MYAIETAKLSSKGQMVIPDSFRKRYGWMPGATLMLIGTGDSLVIQSLPTPDDSKLEKTISESHTMASAMAERLRAATVRLNEVKRIGISLPVGMEDGDARRKALMEKHG
jgi:bifunctional DNA-binding transcriptional regulator/antitoxin component of YhaV-PrlF toxin-antitoxin module